MDYSYSSTLLPNVLGVFYPVVDSRVSELARHTFSVTPDISFSFATLRLLSTILQIATALRHNIIFISYSVPIRMRACMCLLLKLCPCVS
jgi:hypothetical protein